MSNLGRRLTALEHIAHDKHRQEMRDLLMSLEEARDLTPEEIEEAVTEAVEHLARMRGLR